MIDPTFMQDTIPDEPSRMTGGMPTDLLFKGARRLRMASLACIFVSAVVLGVMNFVQPAGLSPVNAVAGATVSLSLVMYLLSRSAIAPQRLLDLGLIYAVLCSFGIALAEVLATYRTDTPIRGISWVCLWITLFPLIVPSSPIKTLVVSVVSATTGPLALIAVATHRSLDVSLATFGYLFLPNYGAAALAVIFSRVLYQLGGEVRRAREMGSYQLVQLLGRGGMGEVWQARHRRLKQPAAIKLVHPDALGGTSGDRSKVMRRFEREALATAMLNSPHTIQIYDFGSASDGSLYYVMELLHGIDLETMVMEYGPLPPSRTVYLLIQVCESLAEAHDSGLIHRDIKPANIYVCKLGTRHDFVKVLDFGIVGVTTDLSLKKDTKLTADGVITGTPAYMAPETVTSNRKIDERVDIYALGCVAYWMLTGELVFDCETLIQMMLSHVDRTPVPPSHRTDRPIPATLEEIIMECLAKDPGDRPQHVEQIASRLRACRIPDWTADQAASWWHSHPTKSQLMAQSSRRPKDTILPVSDQLTHLSDRPKGG